MGVDSDVREYHRRREAQRNAPEEAGPKLPPNFTPRNVRVKREKTSPEVDFKTRMKMMSKSKAKTNTWIKKEDPDGPKIKKEKSVTYYPGSNLLAEGTVKWVNKSKRCSKLRLLDML